LARQEIEVLKAQEVIKVMMAQLVYLDFEEKKVSLVQSVHLVSLVQ
jgi:hypothetical protein